MKQKLKQLKVCNIFKMGGFNLRKWIANMDVFLSNWPSESLAEDSSRLRNDTDPFLDDLDNLGSTTFNSSFDDLTTGKLTKRSLLSKIASSIHLAGWRS